MAKSAFDSAADVSNATLTLDTSQAVDSTKTLIDILAKLDQQYIELEKELGVYESKSTQAAANIVAAFQKVGAAIKSAVKDTIGLGSMAVKPAIDLDNYMGVLNTKVTQLGGNLEQYRNIVNNLKSSFKPNEMGYGMTKEEYNAAAYKFTSGAVGAEKYGGKGESNLKGFTEGAAGLTQGIGMNINEATDSMTALHKAAGLGYEEMGKFSKELAAVGRTTNLTSGQTASLVKNLSGLSRAYGLSGEASKVFITNSMAVAGSLSQLGLNADEMMAKMNRGATGGVSQAMDAAIESLALGFDPTDKVAQQAAEEKKAKEIVAAGERAGPQMRNVVMQQMAEAYHMPYSSEQLTAMAKGVGGKTGTEITKDIQKAQTPEAKDETPFRTFQMGLNQSANTLSTVMEKTFKPAMEDLKKAFSTTLPEAIKKMGGLAPAGGIGIAGMLAGGAVLVAIKAGVALLGVIAGAVLKIAMSGGGGNPLDLLKGKGLKPPIPPGGFTPPMPTDLTKAGQFAKIPAGGLPAAGGLMATMGTSVGAASAAAIAGTVAVGLIGGALIGTLIDKVTDKVPFLKKLKEGLFDKVVGLFDKAPTDQFKGTKTEGKTLAELAEINKKKREAGTFGTAGAAPVPVTIAPTQQTAKVTEQLNKQAQPKVGNELPYTQLAAIAKKQGFNVTSTTGGKHLTHAHPEGRAIDISLKDAHGKKKSETEIAALLKELNAIPGAHAGVEKKGANAYSTGDHIHAQFDRGSGAKYSNTQMASMEQKSADGKASLNTVHDTEANKKLNEMTQYLQQIAQSLGIKGGFGVSDYQNAIANNQSFG